MHPNFIVRQDEKLPATTNYSHPILSSIVGVYGTLPLFLLNY